MMPWVARYTDLPDDVVIMVYHPLLSNSGNPSTSQPGITSYPIKPLPSRRTVPRLADDPGFCDYYWPCINNMKATMAR